MTRISRKKLQEPVKQSIGDQLLMSIVHARTKREAGALLTELLGASERTMLAKRFAIVVMLVRNYSAPQIEEMLKVSPDTVGRVWRDIRKGRYLSVIRYAKNNPKKFEGESFSDLLTKFLQAGLPPRGRGKKAYFDKLLRQSEYFES